MTPADLRDALASDDRRALMAALVRAARMGTAETYPDEARLRARGYVEAHPGHPGYLRLSDAGIRAAMAIPGWAAAIVSPPRYPRPGVGSEQAALDAARTWDRSTLATLAGWARARREAA